MDKEVYLTLIIVTGEISQRFSYLSIKVSVEMYTG